eukprot:Sspe_Gene.117115::Locus_107781_Transcript_1_1_Confidence_1.000_Length_1006::g.117115::m.117115/K10203/ELOVL6; elongation of very long chain fatty acids protein 6
MEHVEQLLSLADGYDCRSEWEFVANERILPIATVAAYVAFVFLVPKVLPTALPLKIPFIFWNLLLAAFSWIGFAACARFVWGVFEVSDNPVHMLVCSDAMIWGTPRGEFVGACYNAAGMAAVAFTFSKFAELGDTIFLVLMKKRVEFLHWYHHATVLLYCWFAFGIGTPSALLFGTMNFGVHSVMYLYYAVAPLIRVPTPVKMFVTTLQLLQMAIGLVTVGLSAWYTMRGQCSESYSQAYFTACGAMYATYFLLFTNLFYKTYIAKSRRRKQKAE